MSNLLPNVQSSDCKKSGMGSISFTVVQLFVGVCLMCALDALKCVLPNITTDWPCGVLLVCLSLFLVKYFIDDASEKSNRVKGLGKKELCLLMLAWCCFYVSVSSFPAIRENITAERVLLFAFPGCGSLLFFILLLKVGRKWREVWLPVFENLILLGDIFVFCVYAIRAEPCLLLSSIIIVLSLTFFCALAFDLCKNTQCKKR